ncbi:MAG: discoidin domain-containing protein [Candidatus Saccharimonadales bacterium]
MTTHPRREAVNTGFTIVELLIVIVIIGILAAITIVAYNGIQERARAATLSSDLQNGAKQLKLHYATTNSYPATMAEANEGKGLKSSDGVMLRYSVNGDSFCLSAVNSTSSYMVTEQGAPSSGSCVNIALGASSTNTYLTDGLTTSNPYYGIAPGLASVTVTLGSAQDVSMIKVWHYYADGRTYYATKTEVSADNTNWTTVFDSATSGTYQETAAGKTHTFPMRKVRYIRDWLNGSTSNTTSHWVEIQAY